MVKQEFGSGKGCLEVQWRARMVRYAGSGQRVKKFCQSESISAASFHRWRKLLDCDAGAVEAGRFIDAGALVLTASEASTAIPGNAPDRIDSAAPKVRLDFGHGLSLQIVRR